jgi:tetratricopeptide (TPR) repeat protein
MFYSLRYRFQEGEHACQVAIEAVHSAPDREEWLNLEGWLLVWQACFCRLLGKVDLARNLLDICLERLSQAEAVGQDTRQVQALHLRESEYFTVGLHEKLDYLQKSAALYHALGDPWSQAGALRWAGEYANRMGDYELALNLHQQAETMGRLAGDPRRLAEVLRFLGYDYLIHGPWETGVRLMEDSADLYGRLGDLGSLAQAELHFGITLAWIGHHAEAYEKLESALVKLRQLGDRFYIAYGTLALGIVQLHSGKYDSAGNTLQDGLAAAHQDGFQREEAGCLLQLGCLALARGDPLGALVDVQTSVSNLRKMGFAGELGMALGGLAVAQHKLGQEQQAWVSLLEALRFAIETHSRFTLVTIPAPVVVMLADAGRWEQAVEAYTAVIADPLVSNSRWYADMFGNRMELAGEQLDEAVYKAAEARGREGDVFDVLGRLVQEIKSSDTSQQVSSLN